MQEDIVYEKGLKSHHIFNINIYHTLNIFNGATALHTFEIDIFSHDNRRY